MKASTIATALTASVIFITVASVERTSFQSRHTSAESKTEVVLARTAPERIATVVTLPEVTVRPSAEDLALARSLPDSEQALSASVRLPAKARPSAAAGRPTFDMPYYSFGKVIPHVSQD